ncbi:MAG: mechanosensitive ion channel protein MscS [Leptospiraceae bacterium]|nr:MAG: mechanosensitive ion channel protein MscS [Leptospiraceae bacterium]
MLRIFEDVIKITNIEIQKKFIYTLIIFLIIIIIRNLISRYLLTKIEDKKIQINWRRGIDYFGFIFLVLILSNIWFEFIKNLGTIIGLISAGLALALKDPLTNLAGWLFILTRRPFRVGDRIEIAGIKGDVYDIRLFQFSLIEIQNWVDAEQSTGRIVHIPNAKVFHNPQINYFGEFPYIWDELSFIITFESDWKKAQNIFLKIINKHIQQIKEEVSQFQKTMERNLLIHYKVVEPFVWLKIEEYGIKLSGRYICKPRERRIIQHQITIDILKSFNKNNIHLAYPTERVIIEKISAKNNKI